MTTLCLLGLSAALAPPAAAADPAADATDGAWEELLKGADLSGWRANRDPGAFAVVDGVLRVQAPTRTTAHLFYIGGGGGDAEPVSFKNFALEAVVRAEPGSNSGIFFHTTEATRDGREHLADGYEVQLNSSAAEARKTGSLYAVVDLKQSPVDETEWFAVRVVVNDRRITVAVDRKQVVDYTEPPDVTRPPARAGRRLSPTGGALALQAHDPGSVWYFQSLRVKRLP